ncbi:MAG: chaperone NapD [Sulfurovum sp.]|nr:chaperone NapD [Sulfurovum sp.]MDD3602822.1 chaperone NapD [Sulfurovum sp.]
MNISSIVVQVRSERYDEVKEALEASGLCDYHFGDKEKGKIIITIEGENVEEEVKKLKGVQAIPGVIAADMMQTYQEELDGAIKELEAADNIPYVLQDETIDFRDVVYNGDLRKKDL